MGPPDPDTAADGVVSEQQQQAARTLLESVVEAAAEGGNVEFRSVEYGPKPGTLGFNYRRGTLMVEFQTKTNAGETIPDERPTNTGLVELGDHTPLGAASDRYEAVERRITETVAEAVVDFPRPEALDPVTVWPVASEAGLYRVGFDPGRREFLYAVSFKIPVSALE